MNKFLIFAILFSSCSYIPFYSQDQVNEIYEDLEELQKDLQPQKAEIPFKAKPILK
jgi:hypothetical protein